MSDNTKKWDDFWEQRGGALHPVKKVELWTDLVWRVGLEYWRDIFERFSSGKEVLECGCGSARLSQYMSLNGFSCTMLDNSEKGVELAKQNFINTGLQGKFLVGDVNNLKFEDGTFDIVYSGGLIHHFESIDKPISEMVRVLKPGGLFSATVITNKFSCQTIGNFEQRAAYFMCGLLKLNLTEVKDSLIKKQGFYVNSISLNEYIRSCGSAGLSQVVGLAASPFPYLSLPMFGQKMYAKLMKRMIKLWQKFDVSTAKWTEIWGAVYNVYGIKGRKR